MTARILIGDCRSTLASIEASTVQAIITSPPYFGLRNYDNQPHQIGIESQVQDYIRTLVDVFKTPSLREDGLIWVNLGDSYHNGSLLGVPWLFAFAMKDAGFILRSEIIWHKPDAMPESVRNRVGRDHEIVFMFSKGNKYKFNKDAIMENSVTNDPRKGDPRHRPNNGASKASQSVTNTPNRMGCQVLGKRHKRSVWRVAKSKTRESHFATYPTALVEPMILASTDPGDLVLDPFLGSGTTAVAAVTLGRQAIGCELSEKYAEIARQRLCRTGTNPLVVE